MGSGKTTITDDLGVNVSHSVISDSLQPTRLLCPRNSPGENTGVGNHALLQRIPNPGFAGRLFTIWATREVFHLTVFFFYQICSSPKAALYFGRSVFVKKGLALHSSGCYEHLKVFSRSYRIPEPYLRTSVWTVGSHLSQGYFLPQSGWGHNCRQL